MKEAFIFSDSPDAVRVSVDGVTFALLAARLEDDQISGLEALPDVRRPLRVREAVLSAARSGPVDLLVSPGLAERIARAASGAVPFMEAAPDFDPEDESEALFRHVEEGDEDISYGAVLIPHDELAELVGANSPDDMSVIEAFEAFATPASRAKVSSVMRADPFERIIIIRSEGDQVRVIDGHHRVVAAHLAGRPLLAIDLSDPRGPAPEEPAPGV